MKKYKTSENMRRRLKETRDAIKAAGGPAYEELLRKERAARAEYRKKNPQAWKDHRARRKPYKTELCRNARSRARQRGIEATITAADLHWPTHCPVLGMELDYPTHKGQRKDRVVRDNYPSLDRWDPNKGYVPGNVFVISYRANTLKNNGNIEEMLKIVEYLRSPPAGALSEIPPQITS